MIEKGYGTSTGLKPLLQTPAYRSQGFKLNDEIKRYETHIKRR